MCQGYSASHVYAVPVAASVRSTYHMQTGPHAHRCCSRRVHRHSSRASCHGPHSWIHQTFDSSQLCGRLSHPIAPSTCCGVWYTVILCWSQSLWVNGLLKRCRQRAGRDGLLAVNEDGEIARGVHLIEGEMLPVFVLVSEMVLDPEGDALSLACELRLSRSDVGGCIIDSYWVGVISRCLAVRHTCLFSVPAVCPAIGSARKCGPRPLSSREYTSFTWVGVSYGTCVLSYPGSSTKHIHQQRFAPVSRAQRGKPRLNSSHSSAREPWPANFPGS